MCDTSGMPMPGAMVVGQTGRWMRRRLFLCQSLATRFAYAINSKARGFFSAFAPRSPQFFFNGSMCCCEEGRVWPCILMICAYMYTIPENLRFWAKTFFPFPVRVGRTSEAAVLAFFGRGKGEREEMYFRHASRGGGRKTMTTKKPLLASAAAAAAVTIFDTTRDARGTT